MIIKCMTTDGELMVGIKEINFIISDPQHPETVMMHLKGGKAFEVSGTFGRFQTIFNTESSYYDGGVIKV
jgi:hypothetical protein